MIGRGFRDGGDYEGLHAGAGVVGFLFAEADVHHIAYAVDGQGGLSYVGTWGGGEEGVGYGLRCEGVG